MNDKRRILLSKILTLNYPLYDSDAGNPLIDNIANELIVDKPILLKWLNSKDGIRGRLFDIIHYTNNISFKNYVLHVLGNKFYYISKNIISSLCNTEEHEIALLNRGWKIYNIILDECCELGYDDMLSFCIRTGQGIFRNESKNKKWLKYELKYSKVSDGHIYNYNRISSYQKLYENDRIFIIDPKVLILVLSKYSEQIKIGLINIFSYGIKSPILLYFQLLTRKRKKNIQLVDPKGNLIEKLITITLQKFTTKNMTKLITYFI